MAYHQRDGGRERNKTNPAARRAHCENEQPSHMRPTPPKATGALERPPKRPRRRTIQSTTYTDSETEPDAQVPTERVRLSDDSSDVYEDSRGTDQTESDTEPDAEDDDIPDGTGAGLRHRSRTADKQTNNQVSTVQVSTPPHHRRKHSLGGRQQLEDI